MPAADTFRVVAYDFGVKRNILRLLADRGCNVTVVPAKTTAAQVLDLEPDGVFLSNGPGDPEPCDYAIRAIAELVETGLPTFGICLGHQLLSLASGAATVKMSHGHHGANHPVKDLRDGRVIITSQNHGFAVDQRQLAELSGSDARVAVRRFVARRAAHRSTRVRFPGSPRSEPRSAGLRISVRSLHRSDERGARRRCLSAPTSSRS